MNTTSRWVLLLTAAVSLQSAEATVYYVSPSGNDSNNGVSPTSAWATVARVNSARLAPGDSVLFARGGTWREALVAPASGASGAPILFGSFGTTGGKPVVSGADILRNWTASGINLWAAPLSSAPRQVFRNGLRLAPAATRTALTPATCWFFDSTTGVLFVYSTTSPAVGTAVWETSSRPYCIRITNKSYLTFQNLTLRQSGTEANFSAYASAPTTGITLDGVDSLQAYNSGIAFYNDIGGSYSSLILNNVTDQYSAIRPGASGAITLGTGPGGPLTTVQLTSVHVAYAGVHGDPSILPNGVFGINFDQVSNATVDGVEVHRAGSSGINIQNGSIGITIANGSIHHNGNAASGDRNGIGIGGLGNGSSNITVDSMQIYANVNHNVEIATTNWNRVLSNVTIRRTTLSTSGQSGIQIGGGHTNILLDSNRIFRNGDNGVSLFSGSTGRPSVTASNNVICFNGATGAYQVGVFNDGYLNLRGNLIGRSGILEIETLNGASISSDTNTWDHPSGGQFMQYHNLVYDLSGWVAAAAQDTYSTGPVQVSGCTAANLVR